MRLRDLDQVRGYANSAQSGRLQAASGISFKVRNSQSKLRCAVCAPLNPKHNSNQKAYFVNQHGNRIPLLYLICDGRAAVEGRGWVNLWGSMFC